MLGEIKSVHPGEIIGIRNRGSFVSDYERKDR